jgi:hypothetical protein
MAASDWEIPNHKRTLALRTAMLYMASTWPMIHFLSALAEGHTEEYARQIASESYGRYVADLLRSNALTPEEKAEVFLEFDPHRSTGGFLMVLNQEVQYEDALHALTAAPVAS